MEDLYQGGPWDDFDYKCPPLEAKPPLHLVGSRQLEGNVNGVEHDRQLCCPMQGSAAMSCVDNKNLNATEVHQELGTIYISDLLVTNTGVAGILFFAGPTFGCFLS